MPKLFVVGAQKNLAELMPALLKSRTSATVRATALDAIKRANPSLDLDRITPGTVVVVPAVEGIKPSLRADDPVDQVADDLAERVREGIGALVAATKAAGETHQLEWQEAQELLGSSLVQRLASQSQELAANVDSARATIKADASDGRRQLAELAEAADGWTAELDALRRLMP